MIRVCAHPSRAGWRRYWFDCDACSTIWGPLDEPRGSPEPTWLEVKLEAFGAVVVAGEGRMLHEMCRSCADAGRKPLDTDERERRWLSSVQQGLQLEEASA